MILKGFSRNSRPQRSRLIPSRRTTDTGSLPGSGIRKETGWSCGNRQGRRTRTPLNDSERAREDRAFSSLLFPCSCGWNLRGSFFPNEEHSWRGFVPGTHNPHIFALIDIEFCPVHNPHIGFCYSLRADCKCARCAIFVANGQFAIMPVPICHFAACGRKRSSTQVLQGHGGSILINSEVEENHVSSLFLELLRCCYVAGNFLIEINALVGRGHHVECGWRASILEEGDGF